MWEKREQIIRKEELEGRFAELSKRGGGRIPIGL